MRRALPLIVVAVGVILALLVVPLRNARTQPLGEAKPAPGLDPSRYSLGELLEGNGPLEQVDLNAMPGRKVEVRMQDFPAPVGYAVDFKHYPTAEETNRFLDELERDYPTLVETYEVGRTWQDRPIRALRITNEAAPGELRDRPAMYVDGQHHARELISNQVATYTAWYLLNFYGQDPLITHLVDTRVLYVLPSANPDGNELVLTDYQVMRKTLNPSCCDDDFNAQGTPAPDGKTDEDYSVGYGYGTHDLYRYHFKQAWADAHPADPFVDGWQQQQEQSRESLGRYTGALGGPMQPIPRRDMDGDGLQDEDELGGVDSNRNYDTHWEGGDPLTPNETYRGPSVWSEPETRAVRDFLLELDRVATGIAFHSGTDVILHPWGWSASADLPDVNTFELISRKGSQLTEVNGFPGSPHTWTARGLYSATGSTMDWLYEQRGVLAWSPEVYGGSARTLVQRLGATGTYSVGTAIGFQFNPRPDQILASTDRWKRFLLYVLSATPNVEVNNILVDQSFISVTVSNDGVIPVEVTVEAQDFNGGWVSGSGPQLLSAGSGTWQIPWRGAVPVEPGRIRVRARLNSGTKPHEVELVQLSFTRTADGVVVVDGGLRPFMDLGAHFGGWWAPAEFDEADKYHIPGNRPIAATPPATPTALATLTPPLTPTTELFPTDTPTGGPTASATETPTAIPTTPPPPPTDGPRPAGLVYLPRLMRR
jgi:hypothetical protein